MGGFEYLVFEGDLNGHRALPWSTERLGYLSLLSILLQFSHQGIQKVDRELFAYTCFPAFSIQTSCFGSLNVGLNFITEAEVQMTFFPDDKGDVSEVLVNAGGQDLKAKRVR